MRNYKESDIQNSQNKRLDDNRGVPSMPNIKLYVEKLKRYLDIYSHASISNRTDDGVKDVYTQYEIEEINEKQGIIRHSSIQERDKYKMDVMSPIVGTRTFEISLDQYAFNKLWIRIKYDIRDMIYLEHLLSDVKDSCVVIQGWHLFYSRIDKIYPIIIRDDSIAIKMELSDYKEI